jgi:hypothetical protein
VRKSPGKTRKGIHFQQQGRQLDGRQAGAQVLAQAREAGRLGLRGQGGSTM